MMGLIKRKILQLMTPSGNSFGRVILFNAFGNHGYGNLIISFSVAISYFSMPFSQSNTLSRAELILIQIMKIEYYNKVSFSLFFLLNEKKKKKKRRNYHVAIDSTFDYDCLR